MFLLSKTLTYYIIFLLQTNIEFLSMDSFTDFCTRLQDKSNFFKSKQGWKIDKIKRYKHLRRTNKVWHLWNHNIVHNNTFKYQLTAVTDMPAFIAIFVEFQMSAIVCIYTPTFIKNCNLFSPPLFVDIISNQVLFVSKSFTDKYEGQVRGKNERIDAYGKCSALQSKMLAKIKNVCMFVCRAF